MLDDPEAGILLHPTHPDTMVTNMGQGYTTGGCSFSVLEPMRSWKVTYNGLLR